MRRLMNAIKQLICLACIFFTSQSIAEQSIQFVYEGNLGAYISAPPGWVHYPANSNDDRLGILTLYRIKNKSINDAQIAIQMIPQKSSKNMLENEIKNDKKRNLNAGGKFLGTEPIGIKNNGSASINLWSYPTNNNFIGIATSENGSLIVGGYSMKKDLDKETKIAVEHIIKNAKFVNVIR
jgi:hypothetical protein